jgi:rubrerythrin
VRLNTCSEVISLAKQLENESAKFYQDLSQKYTKDEDVFLSFVKENRKYVVQIERAYYGVISDAIEGCFAFDIDADEYTLATGLAPNTRYSDALEKAIEMEEKVVRFYSDAAEQSMPLMADVPRAFKIVAKKRDGRRLKLKSLLEKEG